ncbi:MAG: 2Fe-2S iron-sulfur cluster binding domain-containing protein, partial [Clostridia bacterium]|nr:2Fe-2S iron-sulfur cluster binding domain-containing protein [Clostridia bacterium]
MEYTVRFTDENREVRVPAGTTLLQARIAAKLEADAPCGGRGTCGKCRCEVRGAGEAEWHEVLMCQTPVNGEMEVRAAGKDGDLRVLTDAEAISGSWNPVVKAVRLTVPPCPRGESSADWTRLVGALKDAGIHVA